MTIIAILIWIVLTIIAWRRGWKWLALCPWALSFCIGFCGGWFYGEDFMQMGFAKGVSTCCFIWLICMALFKKPKARKPLEG